MSESINRVGEFIEELKNEYPQISIPSHSVFFSEEGTEILDEAFFLVKNDDTIYLEAHGNKFDNNNILGQYAIVEKIGEGGFGNVHKAENKETGKIVAIKYIDVTDCSINILLSILLVYHASKVEEIYKEAKALKKLSHPNIVKLHHAFLWKNYVVLIMEYIAGGELLKYVNTKGPSGLTESEARTFFQQLADAVCYCHSNFIIHRDLKPENVLLASNESKEIKVIFIGLYIIIIKRSLTLVLLEITMQKDLIQQGQDLYLYFPLKL